MVYSNLDHIPSYCPFKNSTTLNDLLQYQSEVRRIGTKVTDNRFKNLTPVQSKIKKKRIKTSFLFFREKVPFRPTLITSSLSFSKLQKNLTKIQAFFFWLTFCIYFGWKLALKFAKLEKAEMWLMSFVILERVEPSKTFLSPYIWGEEARLSNIYQLSTSRCWN